MQLTKSLQTDLVKHLRPKSPLSVALDSTVRDAISLMQQNKVGCVLICDPTGRAVGIFTERDVLRRVIGEHVAQDSPIKEVMSKNLASVKEADPITDAFKLLHTRGLRHLPVVDESGRPTGVVSVKRIMEYLVEHFPQEIYNLPPNPSPSLGTREGA